MSEYIIELDGKHSIALKLALAEEIRGGDFVHGEIVRCRDCKHFTYADAAHMGNDWCAKHDHIGWSVNGFCAWGERRDA